MGASTDECFPGRGIKQGAPESSAVFSMVVDHILAGLKLYKSSRDALFSGEFAFPHTPAWVDDLYLMTSTLQEMQSLVDQVMMAFGSVGLLPNLAKLRLLRSDAAAPGHVQIHTTILHTADPALDVHILGMQFSLKKGVSPHLECAISKAWKAFATNKRVLCDRTVEFSHRVHILNMLVQPVLLWCSCNWTPNKTMVARLNSVHVKMLSHMWSTKRHRGQTWLDAHRVRFRTMWARVRAASLHHGVPASQLYPWGLKFLQSRHGWIGHAFRHFSLVLRAFQWRSFHWWWHQQQLPVTGRRHPGRFFPLMADTDLRRLFQKLHAAHPTYDTIFSMAGSRQFWSSTLPVYLSMYKDLRLHGPSTAALMDEHEASDDAVEISAIGDVNDLHQQQ